MTDATANSNSIVYLSTSTGSSTPADYLAYATKLNPHATVRQIHLEIRGSDTPVESAVAPWYGAVQRRLNASIGAVGSPELESGASLSPEVVSAANSFFAAASAVLPSEPYLYGLPNGKLVAEFATSGASLTVVISDRSALAMSTVNGETVHAKIALLARTPTAVQKELTAFTGHLRTEQHGSLETGK